MVVNEAPAVEVVKWYTRARKFPQLIGRTPDGRRIPGGPYTFTQAIGAGVVLLVGVNTMGLWAGYGLIGNGLILLGAAYGMVLLLGRIPVGSRSPLAVVSGGVRALGAPRVGRLAGRPVRLRRPRRVRHRVVISSVPAAAARKGGPQASGRAMPDTPTAPADAASGAAAPVGRSPATVGKVSVATPAAPAGAAGTTPPSRRHPRTFRPAHLPGSALLRRRRGTGPAGAAPELPAAARADRWRSRFAAAAGGPTVPPPALEPPGAAPRPPVLSGVQLILARAGASAGEN